MKNGGNNKFSKYGKSKFGKQKSTANKKISGITKFSENTGSHFENLFFTGNDINIHKILNPGWIIEDSRDEIEKNEININKLNSKHKKRK